LWVNGFSNIVESAKASGAPDYIIAQLEANLDTVLAAYRENRGRTGPVPICWHSLDRVPAPVVYTKPILVLIDEFSISAAEMFASLIQDNQRGPLFGYRTNGAGGSVITRQATVFSEATASYTASLLHRKEMVVTPDHPTAPYVENIGVRPEIGYDMMTVENLLAGGSLFTEAFSTAMVEHIRQSR
jgi:C-terminal processing protease CtpA/Prc